MIDSYEMVGYSLRLVWLATGEGPRSIRFRP